MNWCNHEALPFDKGNDSKGSRRDLFWNCILKNISDKCFEARNVEDKKINPQSRTIQVKEIKNASEMGKYYEGEIQGAKYKAMIGLIF